MKDRERKVNTFSEELFSLRSKMQEESPHDIIYVVQDGKFRFVHPHFAAVGKYREDEMLGKESLQFIHPDDRDAARRNAVKMLKGEITAPYEFRIIAKDGSVRWVQETIHPIVYRGKRAVQGDAMDVTAQKEAADRLRELEALQQSILDALPIAVIGMQNRRVDFANHAVEDVFGWKPQELVGQSSRVLYRNDEDFEKIGRDVYRVLKKQRTYKAEFPCQRKDGERIVCLLSASIVGETLRGKHIIATYEDITERKRAEEALAKSEKKLKEVLKIYRKKGA
ncbi:MAG TPA: PAS domain S-box protein [Syntrophales bacterium]|nr:PAS domain S-box protein [Syntrophales bacterium]HOX93505.1 PAS domain S-box protein [Syntrophales bacterium]HPI57525.1 PAS domain S-box protein [Syntrophales bacterium]HPN24682.1 PAS domain S-box protein [Syntrophales bacterium]HQM29813.1 PAS domain S-box protein [Syntrophales bacterium]